MTGREAFVLGGSSAVRQYGPIRIENPGVSNIKLYENYNNRMEKVFCTM